MYQERLIGENEECVPSHMVINEAINTFGQDYRYQDSKHPVSELADRKKDNINIARKC